MSRQSTVPESACPNCNKVMDRATSIRKDNAVPDSGSISICINCTSILIYNDDLQLELLPKDVLREISITDSKTYQLLRKAQRIIKQKSKELYE